MSSDHLPSVYEYAEFREYLSEWYRVRSRVDRSFTRSALCRALGIPNSRSYFADVLRGKFVSPSYVARFVKVLELPRREAQYFRALVRFNQADNADDKELYFEQLTALNRTPTRVIEPSLYAYYSRWYHTAVRAVLDVYDVSDDYGQLARLVLPRITVRQARESVALLTKLGLVARNAKGYHKPAEKMLTTGPYAKDELVKRYQWECVELAKRMIWQKGSEPQDMSTNTMSISGVAYERIQKLLTRFRGQVRSVIHKDDLPADRVYQLDVLLFPSSKTKPAEAS